MMAVSNHQPTTKIAATKSLKDKGCAYVLRNKSARPGGYSKRSAMTGLTRVARLAGIQQASKTTASRSAATAA